MRVVELSLFVNDDAVHKRDLGCWATKHKTPMLGPRGDERKFSDRCEFRDGPTGGLHPQHQRDRPRYA